jgi:hypothetical protein
MIDLTSPDELSWRSTSQRAVSGRRIAPHRALHRLEFSPSRLVAMIALPLLFDLAIWRGLGAIARGWAAVFAFGIEKLELAGSVGVREVDFGLLALRLPAVALDSTAPDTARWVGALALGAVAWIAARLFSDGFSPLRYFLRGAAFVQLTAVVYFLAMPAEFPYGVAQYLDGAFEAAVWTLFVIPWVHALVYYIFDFSILQKAGLTAVTLAFVILVLPLQLLLHAWLLVHGSLVLMPLLFFLFGTWLLMLGCVALYGWAMSWRRPANEG